MFSRTHSIIYDCELSVSLIGADRDCLINGFWSVGEGEISPRGPAAFCTRPYIRIWNLAALSLNCCANCRTQASFLLIFPTDSNASVFPSRRRLRSQPRIHEDFRSLCDCDVSPYHSKYTFLETSWLSKCQFRTSSLLELPDPYLGHAIKVLATTRVSMLPPLPHFSPANYSAHPFDSHPALLFFYIDCVWNGPPASSILQCTRIGFD